MKSLVDSNRPKELDIDPKIIKEIKCFGQLKTIDGDGIQSMFVLTMLEKNQRGNTKVFSRKCNSLIKDSEL